MSALCLQINVAIVVPPAGTECSQFSHLKSAKAESVVRGSWFVVRGPLFVVRGLCLVVVLDNFELIF